MNNQKDKSMTDQSVPFISNGLPPRPKPFHMTEPVLQNGLWVFWLTADDHILHYVNTLNCILPFAMSPFLRRPGGRVMVSINPRYDPLEAWTFIQNVLQGEAQPVELEAAWEKAIVDACQHSEEN